MYDDDELQAVSGPGLNTLLRLFGTGARERGERYAREHRVGELMLTEDPNAHPGWTVDAEVGGSTGNYETWLDLVRDQDGQWWFGAGCDCPVGQRCKHAVALLHELSRQQPEIVPPPAATRPAAPAPIAAASGAKAPPPPSQVHEQAADRWLGQLQLLLVPARHLQPSPQDRIYFVLEQHSGYRGDSQLALRPARAKLLKKTGLPGRLQNLASHHFQNFQAHAHDPDLLFLLQNLEAMQHLSGSHWDTLPWGVLAGALAQPTLMRLMASGRVVTALPDGTPSDAWHWGAERQLDWTWQQHGDALWHMTPCVAGADDQASSAQPCIGHANLYRDDGMRSVGPLSLQGASQTQVQQWLRSPPLPEAWLRKRPELRRLLPGLPAEVAEPVRRCIRQVKPRPVLTLHWPAGNVDQGTQPVVAEAALWFDYDGLRCAPWPADAPERQFIESEQGLVELHREPAAEAVAGQQWAVFASEKTTRQASCRPAHRWHLGGPGRPDAVTTLAGWLAQDFAPLRELGFEVELDADWHRGIRSVDQIDAGWGDDADVGSTSDWLDLSIGFDIDGRRINLLPLLPQVLAGLVPGATGEAAALPPHFWVQGEDGRWWQLPSAPLRPWLEILIELLGDRPGAFNGEALSLSPVEALRLGADQAEFGRDGHAALREVLAPRQAGALPPPPPVGLNASLRPYQQQGWAWMQALAKHRLGGVLADDMGLGKTLQTLTHLLDEKQRGLSRHPSLVVVPTSLVGNWRRECERFTPSLRMLVLHGTGRHAHHAQLAEHDVVLTTYPLLQRDVHLLCEQSWHALVLDEAQTLKNARTHTAKAARQLHAHHRIALTGTPMENHLGELWSLFDLVLPGYLGQEHRFAELYRTPIEKQRDSRRLALLRRRLSPFMLRRDKRTVAGELPPKIEQVVRLQLGPAQANLYETIRAAAEATVQQALAAKGLARSHIQVLDALLKLRQTCCDPRLLKLKKGRQKIDPESAKLAWLLENLPQMLEEGRRVLLFSQFTSMLALIEAALASADLRWTLLTGDTVDREAAIARFTSGEVPLFLISLKAGGTGLNLPQADTVIHFDPWWNPAVENQATDRAHRLGQTQTVFVYKLVAEGTLEERILAMQARKAELARSVQGAADAEDASARLSEADLNWLLQPLGAATLSDASSTEPAHMASA